MKRIILICIILLITNYGYYGKTDKQEEKITQNESKEEEQKDSINEGENVIEQKENTSTEEITQNVSTQNEKQENKKTDKSNQVQITKEQSNGQNQSSTVITNTKETTNNNKSNTQTTALNNQNQNTNTNKSVDLSKYSYYEKTTNGGYKAFIVDRTEINKLRGLIDNVINSFGYKNIKIVEDSSLSRDGTTMYFTANKTNVENAVYDSEGFTIHYYALKEYSVSSNGTEKYFQTRAYIKVK